MNGPLSYFAYYLSAFLDGIKNASSTVGARILSVFGFQMVDGVWFSNVVGFRMVFGFLNGFEQNGRHFLGIRMVLN